MVKLLVRGTGCANVRTSGSVGALAGNRQGHPARGHLDRPSAPGRFFVTLTDTHHGLACEAVLS